MPRSITSDGIARGYYGILVENHGQDDREPAALPFIALNEDISPERRTERLAHRQSETASLG